MRENDSALTFINQSLVSSFECKMANMSIGVTIRALRKAKQWTQEDLAKRVNVSRGRIGQIETDPTTEVKAETLLSLAKALGCEPSQLKSGLESSNQIFQPGFEQIPVLDVELAAGNGTHIDMERVTDWVPISQDWIYDNYLPKERLVVVTVTGDSMTPRLQEGDMLLVNTGEQNPTSGCIYAIAVENELRVKRLLKRMDGAWIISSDNKANPAYQDEVISHHNFHQLRIIGRAVKVLMGNL